MAVASLVVVGGGVFVGRARRVAVGDSSGDVVAFARAVDVVRVGVGVLSAVVLLVGTSLTTVRSDV